MYGQLAGQSDALEKAVSFFGDPRFKQLPDKVQEAYSLLPLIQGAGDQAEDLNKTKEKLKMYDEYYGSQARRAQELGKESVQEAFKYSTLANIPKTIAQSFGNIAAMNVLGARNATEAMAQTLASYPRASFPAVPYQPQKYFS
jgi:hypothetical protein